MENKLVSIVGAFGFKKNLLGGQITKNRILLSYLKNIIGSEKVGFVDTSDWKRTPIAVMKKVKSLVKESKNIIITMNKKGILYLLPFIVAWNQKSGKNLRYIVIGGWLPDFIDKHPSVRKNCLKIDQLYVETLRMKEILELKGLDNVAHLPNFKNFDFVPNKSDAKNNNILRTVFFSRVCKEKGVELAIDAVKQLSKKYAVKLDIYGPIDDSYKRKLELLIKDTPNIRYNGVLKPDTNETYEILSQYDLMLFPTLLENEGFAGAIIDSFIAGVPVLASKWPNGLEIITENETGWFFEQNNIDELVSKLEFLIKNKNKLYSVRGNCIEEAKKYHVDNVLPKLLKEMNIEV